MQKFLNVILITASLTIASCGSKTEGTGSLAEKKAEIEKLKKEQGTIADKIKLLEKEVAKLDTAAVKEDIAKLVGLSPVTAQNFAHYIDLQGRVDADDISYVSPRLGGGQVRELYVKRGDYVKKGQLLVKLDDAVLKQQINASKQGTETLKTQLTLAKDVYTR